MQHPKLNEEDVKRLIEFQAAHIFDMGDNNKKPKALTALTLFLRNLAKRITKFDK